MDPRGFPAFHVLLGLAWAQLDNYNAHKTYFLPCLPPTEFVCSLLSTRSIQIHLSSGAAQSQKDCGNCYHLSTSAILGVVMGDLILTLLIALAVYYVASYIYKRQLASKELKKAEHESHYEELQGPRLDIYSAIRGSDATYK